MIYIFDILELINKIDWYDITKDLILPIINIIAIGVVIPVVLYKGQHRKTIKSHLQNEYMILFKNYYSFYYQDCLLFCGEVYDRLLNTDKNKYNELKTPFENIQNRVREFDINYNFDWTIEFKRFEMLLGKHYFKYVKFNVYNTKVNLNIKENKKTQVLNYIAKNDITNYNDISKIVENSYFKYSESTYIQYLEELYEAIKKY